VSEQILTLQKELNMKRLIQAAKDFARNEEGATAIEYGLLAALVSVVIIGALTALGSSLNDTFTSVSDKLKAPAK
jgi:pilus assembly protein Flp/PilA